MAIQNINIKPFFHSSTNTICYVISDPNTRVAAILDSCLDYDHSSGTLSTEHADNVIDHIENERLKPVWILETHVHADHLSAAPYLKERFDAKIAIGKNITKVQHTFGVVYNTEKGFKKDGSQFDHLFEDEENFSIGDLQCQYFTTPGHTPACGSYKIDDNIFVGDTLFMHDFGTARCDFPGGDARELYRSIKRILAFPEETKLWMCHDYLVNDRKDFRWQTTIANQRSMNPHIRDGISEDDFVKIREDKDTKLGSPKLIVPSIQVNMRAGEVPPPESNGVSYLKIPINYKEKK